MRPFLQLLALVLLPLLSFAQPAYLEKLKKELTAAPNDTVRMAINTELGGYYHQKHVDSALYYNESSLLLAQKLDLKIWEAWTWGIKGQLMMILRNYPVSYESIIRGLAIAEDPSNEKKFWRWRFMPKEATGRINRLGALGFLYGQLDDLYSVTGDTSSRIRANLQAKKIAEQLNDSTQLAVAYKDLGDTYFEFKKPDSALIFYQTAAGYSLYQGFQNQQADILSRIGDVYLTRENKELAKQHYHEALLVSNKQANLGTAAQITSKLARLFVMEGHKDSSLYYAIKCHEFFTSLNSQAGIQTAYSVLSAVYKSLNKTDSAFKYQELAIAARDSLKETENLKGLLNINFREQLRLKELGQEKILYQHKVRTYVMLSGIGILLLLSLLFYRNIRQRQLAKAKIEKAYNELKDTQKQLIQREKMASLGELTAGIAHEIQNPLNFVNNFSEVNNELVDELKEELQAGNKEEAILIADSIKENEQKINHHGKRADAIVKGMLQHSQTSTGQKESTDISKLADEYLRLAYHGLKANDKSFNATLQTDFDETIGNINLFICYLSLPVIPVKNKNKDEQNSQAGN